jgi:hypothetical protein
MKVEHITHGGTNVSRDTTNILKNTNVAFNKFQVYNEFEKIIPIPTTNLNVKVTNVEEGAIFDILKNDNKIISANFCSFDGNHKNQMISHIKKVLGNSKINHPKTNQFIYTILIPRSISDIPNMMIAGEVEFYIYYALYIGRKEGFIKIRQEKLKMLLDN